MRRLPFLKRHIERWLVYRALFFRDEEMILQGNPHTDFQSFILGTIVLNITSFTKVHPLFLIVIFLLTN